ncbi:MAG: type II toxin-antitoxin system RelE/ParE family toxin [Pyrinomonadaceae bacterium]|nr:type II toxin-antitoxin system RelE/ParE family toxin [Pyrinomonadaceae bacterium]MDQ3133538.1 type II toxin-antitoxin system RelE/ParE family toxin [Acidobacteriota bacterium]
MRTIKVAATATEDLQEIWAYVAQHDTQAANKLIKEITGKFALLRDFPQTGREQYKLLVNLRSFAVKDYLIFYQPFADRIEILRVLHGSRDIESIFDSFLDSL